jgi:hypothetical protein
MTNVTHGNDFYHKRRDVVIVIVMSHAHRRFTCCENRFSDSVTLVALVFGFLRQTTL